MAAPVGLVSQGEEDLPRSAAGRRDQDCTLRNCRKVLGGSRKGHCCDQANSQA